MNDRGVSELLGYALIVGMVATAVICITSGAAGAIFSSVERVGHSGAATSVKSLADAAGDIARTNNSCYTAIELQVPPGYELSVIDRHDDVTRLGVTLRDEEVPAIRTGSIRLQSPFRSASFEGGAAFGNDSGAIDTLTMPSIFSVSHNGETTLYIFLLCISADTGMLSPGSHAVLELRAASSRSETIRAPAPAEATITISSRDAAAWARALAGKGFVVTRNGNSITATAGGVSAVHVTRVNLEVRPGGR